MHQNLLKLVFLLSVLQLTASVTRNGGVIQQQKRYCYQCSDSSSKEGLNDCQVSLDTMAGEAFDAKNPSTVEDEKAEPFYVKDCTGYGEYCVIEKIESQGGVNSYIRDCSDGETFSVNSSTVHPVLNIKGDNQTNCGRFLESTVCVRLCKGDFCNGPLPSAASITNILYSSLAICFFIFYTL